MRCFVYFNLHKKLWSIRAVSGPSKGLVVAHASNVVLSDCSFAVSESGRQRVIREQCKNVHAGVLGHLEAFDGMPTEVGLAVGLQGSTIHQEPLQQGVTYNPYKFSSFVEKESLTPVWKASKVALLGRSVTYTTCEGE